MSGQPSEIFALRALLSSDSDRPTGVLWVALKAYLYWREPLCGVSWLMLKMRQVKRRV